MRLAWLLAAAGACDAGPADDLCAEAGGAASLELGTGEQAFEPLEPGSELGFYAGPQGGHHVFVSVRATGLVPGTGDLSNPDDPALTVSLVAEGEELSSFVDRPRLLVPSEDGDYDQLIGQLVVLGHPDPPVLDAAEAALTVTLVDRCGTEVRADRDVTLALR